MTAWHAHIESNQAILNGKPVIKGTRIAVEFILERLASGWDENMLLENYPSLSKESIKAVYAYAYEGMKDGLLFIQRKSA